MARKGIAPAADARGNCDAATTVALLNGPLEHLSKPGEEVQLGKPLTFTAVNKQNELVFGFQFPEGSFVARLQVGEWEAKAGWRAYLLRSPDTTMQVYIKVHREQAYFMSHRDISRPITYPRPTAALGLMLRVDAARHNPRE